MEAETKKSSLFQELRKAKAPTEKIAILEEALKKAKAKAAEEEKQAKAIKNNKDRKLRAKHLYSLGVVLEYFAKPKKTFDKTHREIVLKILGDLTDFAIAPNSPLAEKDIARFYEAIIWLGYKLPVNLQQQYSEIKERQKAKAAAMRAAKREKKQK